MNPHDATSSARPLGPDQHSASELAISSTSRMQLPVRNTSEGAIPASPQTDAYYEGKAVARPRSGAGKAFQKEMSTRHHLTKKRSSMVFVMVGLPARGKSFISRRLEAFLSWKGHSTKVFNVGKYRREAVEVEQSGKSDFFDPNNAEAKKARDAVATVALKDMLRWLRTEGEIAIFDATNSTNERRRLILKTCRDSGLDLGIVFLETLCTNQDVLEENMRCKVAGSPDFAHLTEEEALADLRARIAKYEAVYETIEEDADYSYIKLYNMSSRVLVSGCYGRVAQSILPYLMAIHIGPRPVWLVRAGEGVGLRTSNIHSSIGSPLAQLTDSGKSFAEVLGDYVRDQIRAFQENDSDPADVARRYSRNIEMFVDGVKQMMRGGSSGDVSSRGGDLAAGGRRGGGSLGASGFPQSARNESGADEDAGAAQRRSMSPGFASGSPQSPLDDFSRSHDDLHRGSAEGAGSGAAPPQPPRLRRPASKTMREPMVRPSLQHAETDSDVLSAVGSGGATDPDLLGLPGSDGPAVRRKSSASGVPALLRSRGDTTQLRRSRRVTNRWQNSVVRTANGMVDPRAQLKVLTSTLPRAIATVERLRTPCSKEEYFTLTPLDKGQHMGLSMDEIAHAHPGFYKRFINDHLNTRFPGGECYRDLMNRLEGVLIEIEQQTMPVLVVSHVSVLQVLLCYFMKKPISEAPNIEIPLHTVIELQPTIGGPWIETRTELVPPADGADGGGVGARTDSLLDMPSAEAAHAEVGCIDENAADASTPLEDRPPSPPPIKKNLVSMTDLLAEDGAFPESRHHSHEDYESGGAHGHDDSPAGGDGAEPRAWQEAQPPATLQPKSPIGISAVARFNIE